MSDRPQACGAILLVEDEPFVAIMAQQILEEDGFRVRHAANGADAISVARDPGVTIRAAIVDFGLPDMNGDEVVRALRHLHPALPVLVASGYGLTELQSVFGEGRSICFVSKPYDGACLKDGLADLGIMAVQD
ncbi:response regulator [Aquabacter cavernae]|uniref:response regulator n=1 Tax=Aquabacter cavernae TaxID=2496029 RepID=UPI000F8F3F59|nr:response regulator [Aquabacter cavernae]